jgi:hypothetical protein
MIALFFIIVITILFPNSLAKKKKQPEELIIETISFVNLSGVISAIENQKPVKT